MQVPHLFRAVPAEAKRNRNRFVRMFAYVLHALLAAHADCVGDASDAAQAVNDRNASTTHTNTLRRNVVDALPSLPSMGTSGRMQANSNARTRSSHCRSENPQYTIFYFIK